MQQQEAVEIDTLGLDEAIAWKKHEQELWRTSVISSMSLRVMAALTSPDNIGYEPHQVRPEEVGRLDLYRHMTRGFGIASYEALVIAGVSLKKLQELESFDSFRRNTVVPLDPPTVSALRRAITQVIVEA